MSFDTNITVGRPDLYSGAGLVGARPSRTGSLAGEQVAVKNAASELENSREEISMAHSEKAESRRFEERRVTSGSIARLMRIEQINEYLDATQRFNDPGELAEILKRMQLSRRPGDMARDQSRSPAHQFALLQLALSDARQRALGPDIIERLDDALAALELEAGSEISAGLNTIGAAADFAPTGAGVENFQQAYTDIVLGENTLAQTLLVVLRRLAGARGEDFARGLKAMLFALGADLSATRSSTAPARLQALVQDVYQLEVARSVLEACDELSKSIAARFGNGNVNPLDLMQELVALVDERWVAPARFRLMAEKFAMKALLERIAFLTGSKTVLRKMPVKVFADADTRQNVLSSVQTVLDETVAEEEERQGT